MKKDQNAVRYFVGRFKTKDGKIVYRVMRERKVKRLGIPRAIQEQYAYNGWVKPKGDYRKCSAYLNSRKAARVEKAGWEGKL